MKGRLVLRMKPEDISSRAAELQETAQRVVDARFGEGNWEPGGGFIEWIDEIWHRLTHWAGNHWMGWIEEIDTTGGGEVARTQGVQCLICFEQKLRRP